MKKKNLIIGIAIVVLVAAAVVWVKQDDNIPQYAQSAIAIGEVQKTVSIDATIKPKVYMNVSAEMPTLIDWVGVDVNDYVVKGQELLRLNRDSINAQIRNAQLAIERAELAENQGRRKSSGLDSREILSLKKASEQARQTLREIYAQSEKTSITSSIDGVVVAQNAQVGEVASGMLMRIIDINSLQLEALIPEVDIAKVRPGSKVSIIFDAYPQDSIRGTVQSIEFGSLIIQNNTYYKAIIVFDVGDDVILRDGMNADVAIEIAYKANVKTVSRDFAFKDDDGYFVYVFDDKSPNKKSIKKMYFDFGLIGDDNIEVVDSLSAGQQIVRPTVAK